jgi:hypothetical protein
MMDSKAALPARGPFGCALFLLAGCASVSQPGTPDPALVDALAQQAADHVKRCYRSPKVGHEVRQIVTRLRVRFAPDGSLAGLPEVLAQHGVTPASRPFAPRMAAAATMAIVRCAPIRLPPEAHAGGWEELEITFSPRAFA